MKTTRLLLALSLSLFVCSREVWAAGGVYGIGFSPYVSGQDPNLGSQVSAAQILQRLQIIAPHTTWIRSFGMTRGLENIPQAARQLGLKVAATAWISADTAQNADEIHNLIAAANAGFVDIAIVGSEVIRRNDLTESQLIAYMNQVRQAIPAGIPVTTADVYSVLLVHPNLIAASDIVFANFYPYWDGTSVNNAMCALQSQYQQVVAAAGSKQVVVSETGWPSAGNAVGAAVPSLVNEATFARQFFTWADAFGVPSFYFSAFDEAWKANYEGPQGAHWGIWGEAGAIKPGMDAFFNGAAEGFDCNALLPGPVGLSFVYVPPYGSSDALEVQVTGVRPRDYNIATYIFVNNGWFTKPTSAQRTVAINHDGTAQISIVTGGTDQLATQIAAFLIPAGVAPPLAGGGPLPNVPGAVATMQVTRTASSISGRLLDRQSLPIVGGVVTDPVLGRAVSAPDGKYSFYSITSDSAVLTVSHPNYVFTTSPLTVNIVPDTPRVVDFRGSAIVDLSITSSGLPNPVFVRGNLTQTVTVFNGGPATASDGHLSVSLPDSFEVVSVTSSRGSCTAVAPVSCELGPLPPGASFTVMLVVRPWVAGSFSLSATIAGPDLDPNVTNNATSAAITVRQPTKDFDGDGKADIVIWRPSTGVWWVIQSSNGAVQGTQWGAATDVPVEGDFDGDGKLDIAIWRPSTGVWWVIRSSDGTVQGTQWGAPTDLAVPGDFDGDGKTDIAIWRPSTGVWWVIRSSDGAIQGTQWGSPTDLPVPGDFDGDGKTDLAVWRPSTGVWWVIRSSNGAVQGTQWGSPTDRPVRGDFDGDGKTDLAVWRPSTGVWWVIRSSDGAMQGTQWGSPTDVPVPGDFDGDGKTDIAVWRPSTGVWWVIRSSNGAMQGTQWGAPTDAPVPGD